MFIIMGGTGHIGRHLVSRLRADKYPVTVVTRSVERAETMQLGGAAIAAVDIRDHRALHEVFCRGKRLYVLNPPGNPMGDSDDEERATIASIGKALRKTDFEKIVVQSTYGAQKGEGIGDLGNLYELEQQVCECCERTTVLRAAFYMSNWQSSLHEARMDNVITSVYPSSLTMPMVAPFDVAAYAAELLLEDTDQSDIRYIEGRERYDVRDVAAAFGRAIGVAVGLHLIEAEAIEEYYRRLGFGIASARSFTAMALMNRNGGIELPKVYRTGTVSLENYIDKLCQTSKAIK